MGKKKKREKNNNKGMEGIYRKKKKINKKNPHGIKRLCLFFLLISFLILAISYLLENDQTYQFNISVILSTLKILFTFCFYLIYHSYGTYHIEKTFIFIFITINSN